MKSNRLKIVAISLLLASSAAAEIRVSATEALKAATNKPQPSYSPVARQMKVSGRVEVEAVVSESGKVEQAKAVSGNPLLTQSAVAAVQKWEFTPFTADGKATKAVVTLNFDFKP